jgi:hypothetical protein
MSPRQLPRHPLRNQNACNLSIADPHRPLSPIKNPLHGTSAPHRAPPSVRTFPSAANIQQTQVPSDMIVCRQHTKPTTTPPFNPTTDPHTSTPYYQRNLVNMSSKSNLPPTYKQVLLRERPAHAHTAEQYNPLSRLAGNSLAPNSKSYFSIGRTYHVVSRYYNLARVLMCNLLPLPPGTHKYAKLI